jgi:hypothetical protein
MHHHNPNPIVIKKEDTFFDICSAPLRGVQRGAYWCPLCPSLSAAITSYFKCISFMTTPSLLFKLNNSDQYTSKEYYFKAQ